MNAYQQSNINFKSSSLSGTVSGTQFVGAIATVFEQSTVLMDGITNQGTVFGTYRTASMIGLIKSSCSITLLNIQTNGKIDAGGSLDAGSVIGYSDSPLTFFNVVSQRTG